MKFMQIKKDMIKPEMFAKHVKERELIKHSFVKTIKIERCGVGKL